MELVTRMEEEAPDGYVSFVDRHLVSLRFESAQLAGDAWHAEEIYPEVLSDVAARWHRLELLARWFGRQSAADDYLRQVLSTRAKRWRAEQIYEVEMVVLKADAVIEPLKTEAPSTQSAGLARYKRTGPGRSSIGLKQARFLSPLRRPPTPRAEASIAWFHAYEAYRRRKRVAVVIALIVVMAALMNLRATGQI
ncbi:hypothetical protein DFJ67_4702 [Asanoa ferruginea]|uniref:Uncharacterized protein n=1 Tax=Asanoa ferruginea TaxID=53367 RepID=A0A3D9ZPX6_9ACTN|nr:hypothetical protein [Asanoa ferruginea]REF98684.1 hypothetical protein DFJ67_4702 [Asanoa ferruginea]